MPYGYVTKRPNQIVSNSGVFSTDDVLNLVGDKTFGGSYELIQSQTVMKVNLFMQLFHIKMLRVLMNLLLPHP